MSSKITLKNGPGIPKKAGSTILAPGEPGWSTDLEQLYVGTADPQVPAMVGKPENFVNVKDHGAKGDGTNDDGPAIQKAITESLRPSSGLPIFFPAGNYLVASAAAAWAGGLPGNPNARFFGASKDRTKITQKGPASGLINVTAIPAGQIMLTLSDMSFAKSTAPGVTTYGDLFKYPSGGNVLIDFHRCDFGMTVVSKSKQATETNCTGMFGSKSKNHIVSGGVYKPKGAIVSIPDYSILKDTTFDLSSVVLPTGVEYVFYGSNMGKLTFSNCLFLFGTNDLSTKNVIDYESGYLTVEKCIFDFMRTGATKIKNLVYRKPATGGSPKGLRWVDNKVYTSTPAPFTNKIDVSQNPSASTVHIENDGPKSEVVTPPTGTPSFNVYERHTDGIWWNGTKITP